MLSNLEAQLKSQNAFDRISDVFEEVHQVRRELGYPPLVTPSSQIVGAQATLNVISGERYKIINKQTKDFLIGMYGRTPGPLDDGLLRKAIGNNPRISSRPADLIEPEMENARMQMGELGKDDEMVLIKVLFPQVAPDFFRAMDA